MSIIRRPPVLRIFHESKKVLFYLLEVQRLKGLGVMERLPHRIAQMGVLVQNA